MNGVIWITAGKWIFWIGASIWVHWWGIESLAPLSRQAVSIQVESGPVQLATYIKPPPPPAPQPVAAPVPPPVESLLSTERSDREIQPENPSNEPPLDKQEAPVEPKPEAVAEDLPEEKWPVPDPFPVEESITELETLNPEPSPPEIPLERSPPLETAGALTEEAPQALVSPAPDYPRIAIRRGFEGVVILEVDLKADGRPSRVRVAQSSGFALLDREARETVQQEWQFDGQEAGGKPFRVEIEFRLSEN